MTAYFVVRAQLSDQSLKKDFDRWYQEEHLSDARSAFGATRAFRGWSEVEPAVHYAYYEFKDAASANAIRSSESLKRLVAEFDRVWGDKVTRSRDVVEIVQTLV
jgi:hypothetical protein